MKKQIPIEKHKKELLFLFGTFICLAVLIAGCLDKIEFDRPKTIENGIAIQGKLVLGEPSYIRVTTRKVFDFKESGKLINVRAVLLIDDEGNQVGLDSRQDGLFTKEFQNNSSDIQIAYGKSYKIRVETFDNRIYESALESILPVPEPQNLTFNVNNDRKSISFAIDTPLEVVPNGGNVKLLWELEATYKFTDTPESYGSRPCSFPQAFEIENKTCFFNFSPVNNYLPLDGTLINDNSISGYELYGANISFLFSEGYYLSVFQQSMTESAFQYWSQVNQVLSKDGSLFEPPVGKIITNFTNINDANDEAFGYFYATEEKAIRVFVSRAMANFPTPRCPSMLTEDGRASNDCCDCLSVPNSTIIRPAWWIE